VIHLTTISLFKNRLTPGSFFQLSDIRFSFSSLYLHIFVVVRLLGHSGQLLGGLRGL